MKKFDCVLLFGFLCCAVVSAWLVLADGRVDVSIDHIAMEKLIAFGIFCGSMWGLGVAIGLLRGTYESR